MAGTKPTTPAEYLATVPDEAREHLDRLRAAIRETVPEAAETISYGMLGYRLRGRVVAYCAGWRDHVALYPVPDGDEVYAAAIAPYRTGRGTLTFSLSEPLPRDLVVRTVQLLSERLLRPRP